MTGGTTGDSPQQTMATFEQRLEELVHEAREAGIAVEGGYEVRGGDGDDFEVVVTRVRSK